MRKEDDSKPAFFDNLSVIRVKYKTRTTCTIRFSFTREHLKNLGGNHPHFFVQEAGLEPARSIQNLGV